MAISFNHDYSCRFWQKCGISFNFSDNKSVLVDGEGFIFCPLTDDYCTQ
jgi:hypothetical protein